MPELTRKTLGRTGLEVTALGFGAMELRGAPQGRHIEPEAARDVLNAVLDSGINYIDTSIDYGQSEELIGRFISHRREEFVLASKCGCLVGDSTAPPPQPGERFPHVFTRENIIAGVNQSLARMKTDHIDVMQFHASPSKATLEETSAIETLRDLQREGKIRFIASSSTLPNLEDHIAMGVFDAFQIPYSALDRAHEEAVAAAGRNGAGIIIRGGVARGAPAPDKQTGDALTVWQRASMEDLLNGMTPMEFMLRFTLTHPELDTTIVGTLNPAHLRDNVRAAKAGPLPQDLYEEAKRRLAAAGSAPKAAGSG